MGNQTSYPPVNLKCYQNGAPVILPFRKAHELLWSSNYGWACPLDWYRWNLEGYSGENHIFKLVGRPGMRLVLLLHTRERQPVTMDEAEELFSPDEELLLGAFVSWASKFNRIFRKGAAESAPLPRRLWPFYYLEIPNGMGLIARPAYQMYPARTYFVVLDIDPAGRHSDVPIDWSILAVKPPVR